MDTMFISPVVKIDDGLCRFFVNGCFNIQLKSAALLCGIGPALACLEHGL